MKRVRGGDSIDYEALFVERCDECPIFHLLFDPLRLCGTTTYIDNLMTTVLEICHYRVGTSLGADPLVARIFAALCSFREDVAMKTVALFICMAIQPSVLEYIRSLYKGNDEEIKHRSRRFENMLPHILPGALSLLRGRANIYTTPNEINHFFIFTIIPTYLCGPNTIPASAGLVRKK